MVRKITFAFCLLPFTVCLSAAPPDRQLWQEYGFQNEETLGSVKAYRFQDSTGALGAILSVPSMMARQHYNYVLDFGDHQPTEAEMLQVVSTLKNIDGAPLPSLPGFLPAGPDDNSQRYIIGPVALQRFAPQIPPGVAGFSYGAEASLARYGDTALILFEYPTQPIARQRIEEFRKLPGITAKRSGPLVAAVLNPTDANAAETLLAKVRYNANLTMDEYVPTRRDNIGHLVLTAFELIGILLVFSAVAGLSFGGWRVFRRKKGVDPEAMITLHLSDRKTAQPNS
jgi:hypothetical protein